MLKICNITTTVAATLASVTLLVALTRVAPAQAADGFDPLARPELTKLPKHQTPVPYAGIRNWYVTQNMGPTGARVWVYGHTNDTLQSHELLVKSIEPGSPADGVLQLYDVIVGAATPPATPSWTWTKTPAVKRFQQDARMSMARAITFAESDIGKGELKVMLWRDGKTETVTIKLPVVGTYARTAPFDCPKTGKIITNSAAFLAENMPPDGYFGLQGSLNALTLYAVNDDRYLDHVRRTAMRMSVNHTITDAGHETWRWGYMNTFLTEYYLATGDKRVLPTIKGFVDVLAAGQCNPGTWGHRGVPDFIPPGYGSMNQSGLICFLSMILADNAGVEVDQQALARSIRFYGSFAGRGAIPYGDHPPHMDATGNGKNGSAAIAFAHLNAKPASQWFARLCASANLGHFEGGHTGNFFNQTWSPLGASLAGRINYQNFWTRHNSYRDMCRRRDGSFVTQPLPNIREGDLGSGNYVSKGPLWNTGGYTLSYLAGNQRLAILGRMDSVFGANPPAQLKPALKLYHEKTFDACMKISHSFIGARDARVSKLAEQLHNAAKRNISSIKLTLADMENNLKIGDLYTLKAQLQAIESVVDAKDVRLEKFRAAVSNPDNAAIIDAGARYYRIATGVSRTGPLGFFMFAPNPTGGRWLNELNGIAKTDNIYGKMARDRLAKYPAPRLTPNTSLISDETKWKMTPSGKVMEWQDVVLPSNLVAKQPTKLSTTFDSGDPKAIEKLMVKYTLEGHMVVRLNGTLILDVRKGRGRPNMEVVLKPVTTELLKAEGNTLDITLTPRRGDEKFTFTLLSLQKQPHKNAN